MDWLEKRELLATREPNNNCEHWDEGERVYTDPDLLSYYKELFSQADFASKARWGCSPGTFEILGTTSQTFGNKTDCLTTEQLGVCVCMCMPVHMHVCPEVCV